MTDDHLSLDELAELDEGLLPPERTSAVRAHLHGCEGCRARAEAISATRSMLAELPQPTMPDDVHARLTDALASERSADDTEPPAAVPDAPPETEDSVLVDLPARSENVVPAPGSVSQPRFGRPTFAASAVAAAVVLAVGAIVIGAINHGHSQSDGSPANGALAPNSETGIATTQPAHFFQTSTGREYTLANLEPDVQGLITRAPATPAASPTAAPRSPNGVAAGAGGGSATSGGSAAHSTVGSPGKAPDSSNGHVTNSKKQAAGQPTALPTTSGQALSSLDQQPVPKALQPLANSRAKILNCAAVLTGSHNAVPLAVDFGRWTNPPLHRVPSAIFVFKSPNPAAVLVYVTPPACDNGTVYTYRLVPLAG